MLATIEAKLQNFKIIFTEYPYIAAVYLYGSYVTGKVHPESDMDIALLLKEGAPHGRALIHDEDYLAYQIGNLFHFEPVDVLHMNGKSLAFQHTVIKTGKLIYDNDPDFRIRYITAIVSRYLDFEPTLRAFHRFQTEGILRRIAKT